MQQWSAGEVRCGEMCEVVESRYLASYTSQYSFHFKKKNNNHYIDEARPTYGLGKQIQEPNIRANVEKASELADERDTKQRCQL